MTKTNQDYFPVLRSCQSFLFCTQT